MEKYLGNKRSVLPAIYDGLSRHCGNVRSICDVFAGTTNVGRYFRTRGVSVISNDVSRFSYVLGKTYLALQVHPKFSGLKEVRRTSDGEQSLRRTYDIAVRRDGGLLFPLERAEEVWAASSRLVSVLAHLNGLRGTKPKTAHVLDHYTVFGKRSAYRSVRGTVGRRNYFSRPNALHLDAVLATIRSWWRDGRLTEGEVHLLLTSVIEEVVITANVNGTFHDFNRDRLWPNSLQEFALKLPLAIASKVPTHVTCDDALRIGPWLPAHDVLYLDPPYNFRQYTAYYHFLNFVAAYPFLDDVGDYLDSLQHVRGQNMTDDFSSEFCAKNRFVSALTSLIDRANSKYVVMSYYGGRNHWNHWANTDNPTDEGRALLEEMFTNELRFERCDSVRVLAVRKNYQSRIGEHKTNVDEHLFIAKRRRPRRSSKTEGTQPLLSEINERLGLRAFSNQLQDVRAPRTLRTSSSL